MKNGIVKINFQDNSEFLDQRTGKYKELGFREYLISFNSILQQGWSVMRTYQQNRDSDCPLEVIRFVQTADENYPSFRTLAQTKAWIRSVGGKHVKHYNSSY
jgi:hypothetical protein